MDDYEFKEINLNDPEDAREFLSSIIINGKEAFTLKQIANMTDAEAVKSANKMHEELYGGEDYVDTRFNRLLN